MIQLSLVPEASEEFAAAAAYYESQQRGLGQAFVDQVEQTLSRISESPKAARVVIGDVRRHLSTVSRSLCYIGYVTSMLSLLPSLIVAASRVIGMVAFSRLTMRSIDASRPPSRFLQQQQPRRKLNA